MFNGLFLLTCPYMSITVTGNNKILQLIIKFKSENISLKCIYEVSFEILSTSDF